MHARRGFFGHAFDSCAGLCVPARLVFEALFDGGEKRRFFFIFGFVEEGGVASFRALAKVKQQRGVAAIIQNHVRGAAIMPFENAVAIIPIFFQRFALYGEHRHTGRGNRGGGMILCE